MAERVIGKNQEDKLPSCERSERALHESTESGDVDAFHAQSDALVVQVRQHRRNSREFGVALTKVSLSVRVTSVCAFLRVATVVSCGLSAFCIGCSWKVPAILAVWSSR